MYVHLREEDENEIEWYRKRRDVHKKTGNACVLTQLSTEEIVIEGAYHRRISVPMY
jgi:hypothetical protein